MVNISYVKFMELLAKLKRVDAPFHHFSAYGTYLHGTKVADYFDREKYDEILSGLDKSTLVVVYCTETDDVVIIRMMTKQEATQLQTAIEDFAKW